MTRPTFPTHAMAARLALWPSYRESSDMTCAQTGFAPLNDVQRTALSVTLGSAARVETALRVLDCIRNKTRDTFLSCRYLDHLSALEQIGLIEYEPGVPVRGGGYKYRCRPALPNPNPAPPIASPV